MLLIPRVSEKAYALNISGTYVFDVPMTVNKATLKKAIESEFSGTKVKDIRLIVVKGKTKATRRGKRARPGVGTRSDFKKAYVTLLEGKIEIEAFKTESEAEKANVSEKSEKTTVREVSEKTEVKRGGLFAKKRSGRRGDK